MQPSDLLLEKHTDCSLAYGDDDDHDGGDDSITHGAGVSLL